MTDQANRPPADEQTIGTLSAAIRQMADGSDATSIELAFDEPQLADLTSQLNRLLQRREEEKEQLHNSAMDLALGISECFQALSAVRAGKLKARVGDATLNADEELMRRLAADLNLTLEQLETTIERQRHAIRTLSTPILQIWNDVLALPIIGVVDTTRSAEMMERLLHDIVEKQTKYVILDITGVEVVDTHTADHFIKVVNAAQLLGAECVVTGIQPAVAQTLVEIGVDLSTITTLRTLHDGLQECVGRLARKRADPRPGKGTSA